MQFHQRPLFPGRCRKYHTYLLLFFSLLRQRFPEELVLLLPEIVAVKQVATIITRVGLYEPARQLTITYNNTTHTFMLTKLIERSHHFERIQYSVIS